ncbi:MAG: hypothetical protein WD757_06900 [Actinomycetota bacterium]
MFAKLRLTDTLIAEAERDSALLRRKGRLMQAAMAAMTTAILITVLGTGLR